MGKQGREKLYMYLSVSEEDQLAGQMQKQTLVGLHFSHSNCMVVENWEGSDSLYHNRSTFTTLVTFVHFFLWKSIEFEVL